MRKPKFKVGDHVVYLNGKIEYLIAEVEKLSNGCFNYLLLTPVNEPGKYSRTHWQREEKLYFVR